MLSWARTNFSSSGKTKAHQSGALKPAMGSLNEQELLYLRKIAEVDVLTHLKER